MPDSCRAHRASLRTLEHGFKRDTPRQNLLMNDWTLRVSSMALAHHCGSWALAGLPPYCRSVHNSVPPRQITELNW